MNGTRKEVDQTNYNQSLTSRQKFLFTVFCWGTQSWGQANTFKTNGYLQKHTEAKKAIRNGLIGYGISITLFILVLVYYKNS